MKLLASLVKILLNLIHCVLKDIGRSYVMGLRKYRIPLYLLPDVAGYRIEKTHPLNLVVEELDAERLILRLGGKNVYDVTSYAERRPVEVDFIPGVLQLRELFYYGLLGNTVADAQMQHHLELGLRITESVNGRYRADNHHVAPLEEGLRR